MLRRASDSFQNQQVERPLGEIDVIEGDGVERHDYLLLPITESRRF